MSIEEPGSGDILLPTVTKWDLLNNFDDTQIASYYETRTGLFLSGDRVIVEDGQSKIAKKLTLLGPPRERFDFSDPTLHSPIIGWALDGAPIYGPFGYTNALRADPSKISRMRSGYRTLSSGEHTNNNNDIIEIKQMIEKPSIENAPSNLAIVGRYILDHKIFDILEKQERGSSQEIQLTDAISSQLDRVPCLGYKIKNERFDCGSKLGFLQANISFALDRKDLNSDLNNWLKTII